VVREPAAEQFVVAAAPEELGVLLEDPPEVAGRRASPLLARVLILGKSACVTRKEPAMRQILLSAAAGVLAVLGLAACTGPATAQYGMGSYYPPHRSHSYPSYSSSYYRPHYGYPYRPYGAYSYPMDRGNYYAPYRGYYAPYRSYYPAPYSGYDSRGYGYGY
jgi:hypothetical protein